MRLHSADRFVARSLHHSFAAPAPVTGGPRPSRFIRQNAGTGTVLVVGPTELAGQITRSIGDSLEVMVFESLDELDRWRAGRLMPSETIQTELEHALDQVGRKLEKLPRKLRNVLESVAHRDVTPPVRDLEKQWPSRRSFYRVWSEVIEEPPSSFLRRVRALHARRLLETGLAPKEAAAVAGFSSVDRMRRQLARGD